MNRPGWLRSIIPSKKKTPRKGRSSPQWTFEELESRLTPTTPIPSQPKRLVIWSHPAFADRCVFARSDEAIVCVSLAAEK